MRPLLLSLMLAGLGWSGSARAADHPNIVQQGFSPDARYHLLLTAFIQDGSGFPSAALQITDVRRNVIVYRRTKTWEQEADGSIPPPSLVSGWRTSQLAVLTHYQLTSPAAGQRLFQVASLPMLDYPDDKPSYRATSLGLLTLLPLALNSGCKYSDFPVRGFALKLGKRVLQQDQHLPVSRQCASGYSLETAWRYKTGLAVIVRSYTQAFEGPDVLPLVVTATVR